MELRAGHTFLYPLKEDREAHLWIVATNPNADGMFAAVSLTSLKGSKDQTVVLQPGEHPFIKWPTCVAYAVADISSCDKLKGYLESGAARMHRDTSPELLKLVFDGFLASDLTKKRVREFIQAYKAAL